MANVVPTGPNMVVLLTGASGFIGRRLAEALVSARYRVICAVRDPGAHNDRRVQYMAADFTKDVDSTDWIPRLVGIDVVINTVGIISEHGAQTFEAIHVRAPIALFEAAAESKVRLVVQISALGADEHAQSRYHMTKKRADDFLSRLPVPSVIVQPSLVFGPGGTSTRLLTTLASLPVIGLPENGTQQVQPVHIDDVVAAILVLLNREDRQGRVPLVGPAALSLKDFLATLRERMGFGKPRFVSIPMGMVRVAAAAGELLPASLLDPETLQLLQRANTSSPEMITDLLGRPPRAVDAFIPEREAPMLRLQARLGWLLPVLRISIALVWIVSGIVSLAVYSLAEGYTVLARIGITGALATVMLYGGALLELGLGVATLAIRRRRWIWIVQAAVILGYTVIIAFRLPEFWLHPYGPLLKNLPMLAAIWLLFELEED